jgi:hypothetical protein
MLFASNESFSVALKLQPQRKEALLIFL